jgi:hypothetical protein
MGTFDKCLRSLVGVLLGRQVRSYSFERITAHKGSFFVDDGLVCLSPRATTPFEC